MRTHYSRDHEVAADDALQGLVGELNEMSLADVRMEAGKDRGSATGHINSVDALVEVLTTLVFSMSFQQAVVLEQVLETCVVFMRCLCDVCVIVMCCLCDSYVCCVCWCHM